MEESVQKLITDYLDAIKSGKLKEALEYEKKAHILGLNLLQKPYDKKVLLNAINSANWECVEHVEKKLGDKATECWQEINLDEKNQAIKNIQKSIPEILQDSKNLTYGDLGKWYEDNKKKGWTQIYDREIENQNILNITHDNNKDGKFITQDWSDRGRNLIKDTKNGEAGWEKHHYSDHNHSGILDNGRRRILYPRLVIHLKVVKDILENLSSLLLKVDEKTFKNKNAVNQSLLSSSSMWKTSANDTTKIVHDDEPQNTNLPYLNR